MNECHPETSPTNLDARQSRQVPDRQDLESNTDTSFIHRKQEDDERRERTLTALRRRYKRREASSFGPDLEEGKGSNLPSINSVDQEAKLHDASLFEPKSNAHTIETTPTDATETGISQRNLPLSIMHRSNFNRKPDDKLREKFKNLIRSSAEGATETQLLANAKSMAEDGAKHDAVRENRIDHPLPIVHHSNYIRKPDDKLREKFRNIRSPADGIPEVHIIGELSEGTGFKDTYVSCKWYLEWGKAWSFLAGEDASQTQYAASDDHVHVWNHPIDVHFATASMQGWPRIIMQLWELDEYGRSILSGYGFAHFPTNPGYHELEVRCWRPSGSILEELNSFFLGTSACLVDEKIIFGKAWETRSQLNTVSSGTVKMNVYILLRFFNEQRVALPSSYRGSSLR